jgi:GNAT superfamily N-acetyltransferase
MASNITLHVAPNAGRASPSLLRQTAIVRHLGFSESALSQWWATTPRDAMVNTPEDIAPLRMYKQIRAHAHQELDPDIIAVSAIIDGEAVGFAIWSPPEYLWRSETLAELIYRKMVVLNDRFEDWLYPSYWMKPERYEALKREQVACTEKYLGPGKINEMWYLHVLVVHPRFQRKGVGASLLDWGLEKARARGEKVYLESTKFGEGLYLKKGFKEVGFMILGENGNIQMPCMLWDPATAPDRAEITRQTGEVENLGISEGKKQLV